MQSQIVYRLPKWQILNIPSMVYLPQEACWIFCRSQLPVAIFYDCECLQISGTTAILYFLPQQTTNVSIFRLMHTIYFCIWTEQS